MCILYINCQYLYINNFLEDLIIVRDLYFFIKSYLFSISKYIIMSAHEIIISVNEKSKPGLGILFSVFYMRSCDCQFVYSLRHMCTKYKCKIKYGITHTIERLGIVIVIVIIDVPILDRVDTNELFQIAK